MNNWSCPVCGSVIAVRIYRKSLLGKTTVPANKGMTVVGYRCQNGHICVTEPPNDTTAKKPAA